MKIHDKILVKGHRKASVCDKRRLLPGTKTVMIKSTCWCHVIVSLMQLKAESRTGYAVGKLSFLSTYYLKQIQATEPQTVCVSTHDVNFIHVKTFWFGVLKPCLVLTNLFC